MKTLANIQGQDAALQHLKNAIESDRMHHGYIFKGPEGVGKRHFALTLATMLLCVKRPERTFIDGCNQCPSCHKMKTLQHPDLLIVEPSGASNTIKINEIREISKFVRNHPFESPHQVIIIDDAHTMTKEASNALLKTLEEPPHWVRMFLVSHRVNRLLDTIRSRGQFVQFKKLRNARLSELVDESLPQVDLATKKLAIELAEGSISRTLSFINEGVLERRQLTLEMIETLDANHPKTINDAVSVLLKSKDRAHASEIVDHLQLIIRDLVGVLSGTRILDDSRRGLLLKKLAESARLNDILKLRIQLSEAKNMISRNGNTTLVFEWLLSEFVDSFTFKKVS